MPELHIYPCTDTLLYLPVYLAIDTFQDGNRGNASPRGLAKDLGVPDANMDCSWEFGDRTRIVLHAPGRGDLAAIRQMATHQCKDGEFAIAIGDPMIGLHNAKTIGQSLKIIATFVNRIALWGVYRKNHPSRRGMPNVRDQIEKIRKHVKDYGPLLPGDFRENAPTLSVAFCPHGETNKYLLKHFIGCDKPDVPVDDFGEPEFKALLEDKGCHVSFTSAPWLGSLFPELEVDAWLPPIPFPFSSIITTEDNWKRDSAITEPFDKVITLFLVHLVMAVALAYRDRNVATKGLYARVGFFRRYGLRCPETHQHDVIQKALAHIVGRDCLSEDLSNPWISWDFAFEARADAKNGGKVIQWGPTYDEFCQRVLSPYTCPEFWKGTYWKRYFRTCIEKYMLRVGTQRRVTHFVD
jgi:hypothetical protein